MWGTRSLVNAPEAYELIQRAAFTEGMCIPPALSNNSLHVFSTAEAVECLSPNMQGRNISVIISGDSYNKQLFVGLADVLLGRAWNAQIKGGPARLKALSDTQRDLERRHRLDPSFPNIQFLCQRECYGRMLPFSETCSHCINAFTEQNQDTVAVVGAGVHIMQELKDELNSTVEELKKFLVMANRTIFNSMPSYQIEKVPKKYKDAPQNKLSTTVYHELLQYLAPHSPEHPFVDFFQLTKSCFMNNCSSDGGHRSRYVNRWKAQLLLNTICEVSEQA